MTYSLALAAAPKVQTDLLNFNASAAGNVLRSRKIVGFFGWILAGNMLELCLLVYPQMTTNNLSCRLNS